MNNVLYINSKYRQKVKLNLYNIINQIVYSDDLGIGLNIYNIDKDLLPRIYILKIESDANEADYSGIHILIRQ